MYYTVLNERYKTNKRALKDVTLQRASPAGQKNLPAGKAAFAIDTCSACQMPSFFHGGGAGYCNVLHHKKKKERLPSPLTPALHVRCRVSFFMTSFTCLCRHTFARTHIHTHIRTYTDAHIQTFAHTHIHTHTHTYAHTHIHTYTHTYAHTHIHTYIHTHTHRSIYVHLVVSDLIYSYDMVLLLVIVLL